MASSRLNQEIAYTDCVARTSSLIQTWYDRLLSSQLAAPEIKAGIWAQITTMERRLADLRARVEAEDLTAAD